MKVTFTFLLYYITTVTERSQILAVPQLRDACKFLLPIASEWKTIAVLLGISQDQVEVIRQENTRVNPCLCAMLSTWLKQIDPNPSWNSLAEAVECLGNQTVAKEIRDKYT